MLRSASIPIPTRPLLQSSNANPYNFTQSTLIFRFYFLFILFFLPHLYAYRRTTWRSFGPFTALLRRRRRRRPLTVR